MSAPVLERPRLETARLRLLVLDPPEAARTAAFHRDNRAHFAPWEPERPADFYATEGWEKRLHDCADGFDRGTCARFGAVRADDPEGRLVAAFSFTNVVRGAMQACNLGYAVDVRDEGQGLVTEALRALVPWAFGPFDLHRIEAGHMPENARSARVLERLGFEREGYARAYLRIAGRWRDHVLWALVRPEPDEVPATRAETPASV